MNQLQMPHSYAALSEAEQTGISGGGPLGDALNDFFGHLHLDDFFWGGGLISLSFSFMPMLLFRVITTGFNFAMNLYDRFSDRFRLSPEGTDMMQYLATQHKEQQDRAV